VSGTVPTRDSLWEDNTHRRSIALALQQKWGSVIHYSRFPVWQTPYEDALAEFDSRKLTERVNTAQLAIVRRLQTIAAQPGSYIELQAMEAALTDLLILIIIGEDLKVSPKGNHACLNKIPD
jgi:hypothetical protein